MTVEPEVITGSVDSEKEVSAVLARAAWCRAACWRFLSFSAGPRCRGQRGGEGGDGAEEGGREGGAPGAPRVQLNPMVTRPLLVVRLREALLPMAQTEMNSVMEAVRNCELVFDDIFTLLMKSSS